MDMIRHQVSLFNGTLFLLRQGAKHLPQMPPQLRVEYLAAIFWEESDRVLAIPLGMA